MCSSLVEFLYGRFLASQMHPGVYVYTYKNTHIYTKRLSRCLVIMSFCFFYYYRHCVVMRSNHKPWGMHGPMSTMPTLSRAVELREGLTPCVTQASLEAVSLFLCLMTDPLQMTSINLKTVLIVWVTCKEKVAPRNFPAVTTYSGRYRRKVRIHTAPAKTRGQTIHPSWWSLFVNMHTENEYTHCSRAKRGDEPSIVMEPVSSSLCRSSYQVQFPHQG